MRIDEILPQYNALLKKFENQTNKVLLYCIVLTVSFGLLLLLTRAYWRRRQDNKQLANVAETNDISALCKDITNNSLSERVRHNVLRRLDSLGVSDQLELKLIEDAAGQLLGQSSETERNIGISAAALGRTLSNRLRHRITMDIPLKKKRAFPFRIESGPLGERGGENLQTPPNYVVAPIPADR